MVSFDQLCSNVILVWMIGEVDNIGTFLNF